MYKTVSADSTGQPKMFHRIIKICSQGFNLNKCSFRFSTGLVNNEAAKNSPLSGIRILDMTRILAGPFCTMLLGDLGAEIIKVENPNGGDETRKFGPPFIEDESIYFISINRNKKSIVVDIKTPEGRDLIKELAKKSDVLIENFIPGKLTDLGLDYESLKSIAPELIYCSISGFGSTGPSSKRPGVDIIAASMGGLMHITGPENGEPCSVGVPLTDVVTGMYAHGAIMAALLQRTKTGNGQKVECDLLSSQVTILTYVALNYLMAGIEANRLGSLSDVLVPYQAFKTKDGGYISVTAISLKAFKNLCEVLKRPDLPLNPMFATNQDRIKNRSKISSILQEIFLTNTTEYWLKALEGSHVPYGPVNNMEMLFKDPQVIHKKMVCDVEHSKVGNVKLIGPAVTYSYSDNKVRTPPPYLGEHTDSVLSDVLSYSPEKIQHLRSSKIVY